jgi:hypothetical protein
VIDKLNDRHSSRSREAESNAQLLAAVDEAKAISGDNDLSARQWQAIANFMSPQRSTDALKLRYKKLRGRAAAGGDAGSEGTEREYFYLIASHDAC